MTDKTPPAGYSKLPDGVRCRCVKLWQGEDGFYCCKPRASEMTDKQTPPDWVLLEAAKRCGDFTSNIAGLRLVYEGRRPFRALCDMIERYEQPPVDRKLLCAREAMADKSRPDEADKYRAGRFDCSSEMEQCIRAIELWESGYGK